MRLANVSVRKLPWLLASVCDMWQYYNIMLNDLLQLIELAMVLTGTIGIKLLVGHLLNIRDDVRVM